MAIIRMRDHLYDEIVNYAKEHLPEEACGLLAGVETGEGREIRKVYFLENKDHAEDHFTLDPRDQINAQGYACQWIETAGKLAFPSVFSIPSVSGGYPPCF